MRVVGLPGDTVSSTSNTIHVDRYQLNELRLYDSSLRLVGSARVLRTKLSLDSR